MFPHFIIIFHKTSGSLNQEVRREAAKIARAKESASYCTKLVGEARSRFYFNPVPDVNSHTSDGTCVFQYAKIHRSFNERDEDEAETTGFRCSKQTLNVLTFVLSTSQMKLIKIAAFVFLL